MIEMFSLVKKIPTKYHLFIELIAYGKESVRQEYKTFAGNLHVRLVNYFFRVQHVRNVSEKIKLLERESGRIISILSVSLIKDGSI